MNMIESLKNQVLQNHSITREEAIELYHKAPLEELCQAADEIRKYFCQDTFDICTIINAKSGRCSEDCKYCAQSARYKTKVQEYPLLSAEKMLAEAKHNHEQGVLRYSIVTSGRRLSDDEVDKVCHAISQIKEQTNISVCVSLGLLDKTQFAKLKKAGASRVHCNLESSRRYFPQVCTTHTYDEKITALNAAVAAGLSVCSGGIMGLGETAEDRVDLALTLRQLKINSIPINFLNPIPGTPYENNPAISDEEKRRIIAVFRFILPKASIRLAGGRGLFADKGEGCFRSGANAAISGDMLTTAGITVQTDLALLKKLGYKVELKDE